MKKLLLGLILFVSSIGISKTYYVDGNAQKPGDGTQNSPFITIQAAADIMQAGDICLIQAGLYSETVVPSESGTANQPLVFQAAQSNQPVIITGLDPVPESAWVKLTDNRFRAKIKLSLEHENQVFRGEKMLVEARWPNTGDDLFKPKLAMMQEGTEWEKIMQSELPGYDYTGAHVWLHTPKYWSNWTTKISGFGKGYLEIENIAPYKGSTSYHVAKKGAEFFVFGCLDALDANNEWFYDESEQALFITHPEGVLPAEPILVKKRMYAFDLQGKSHIQIKDIQIKAASIITNVESFHILIDGLKIFYPYHSYQANRYFGSQRDKGVIMRGKHCIIQNSEIAYSSGCGVVLMGEYNQVLNCYIHDTDYVGTYASCVQLRGKGNVISHCTLTRSGRTVIDYGNMYRSLIQYCDMSQSGLLTSDLGLTYGNVIEGGNSEVRYNWLHDNADDHLDMGLYYDHGTQNIISHHNVVWGVGYSGLHINHYAYYHLIYNNTINGGRYAFRSNWGNKYGPDLHGCRFFNNVFTGACETKAGNYAWGYNQEDYDGLMDYKYLPDGSSCIDNGLMIDDITDNYEGSAPDLGAYEKGGEKWMVGHDFENPPSIDTTRSKPLFRNRIQNSAFEHEDHIQPWKVINGNISIQIGRKGQGTPDTARIRMGGYSMELQSDTEIAQIVRGLEPNTWYEFAGFLRVDRNERAYLGVRDHGRKETHSPSVSGNSPNWYRCILHFKTGPNQTQATVFVRRVSGGAGEVFADDFGLVFVRKDQANQNF